MHRKIGQRSWLAVALALCLETVEPSVAQTFYLVAGAPSHSPETHATVLSIVKEGKVEPIRTLMTQAEGSRSIHINYEARRVVVTSSSEATQAHIAIVDMDHPETELNVEPTIDFGVVDEGFLDVPGQGHLYYIQKGDVQSAGQTDHAFNLEGPLKLAPISRGLLKYRQSFGYALFDSDEFWIAYDPQSGAVTMRGPKDQSTIDVAPPIPPALRPPGATTARIAARNPFMTALKLPDNRVLVYSVRSGWFAPAPLNDKPTVPLRAIGPWLIGRSAKPMSPIANRQSRSKPTPEDLDFLNQPKKWPTSVKTGQNHRLSEKHLNDTYTDTLIVFNVDTGKHYQVRTGDANCEVLWIDDSSMYYRVNGSIYVVKIQADGLANPELVTQGEEIWDVHWAFWSK